jgi:hypothetical protein
MVEVGEREVLQVGAAKRKRGRYVRNWTLLFSEGYLMNLYAHHPGVYVLNFSMIQRRLNHEFVSKAAVLNMNWRSLHTIHPAKTTTCSEC